MFDRRRAAPLLVLFGLFLIGSFLVGEAEAQDAPPPDAARPIVVGSKSFTEGRILAEIMAQWIEARTGLAVERRLGLGGTLLVFEALKSGEIDLYAEYTGTAWAALLGHSDMVSDPLEIYLRVQGELRERYDLRWLEPFGFNNTYALVLREDTAERLGLRRISDLKTLAEPLRFGLTHEFLNREDGFAGLIAAYDLDASARGMEHGLAYEAIAGGDLDVTDAYSTDGKLLRFSLRVLEDDRRFFPPYDAAPLVRGDLLARRPEVGRALAELAFRIDETKMQRLNLEVEEGRGFAETARDFLLAEGLLDNAAPEASDAFGERGGTLARFVAERFRITLRLLAEHLGLTGISVLLAALFGVPLGVLLTRHARLPGPVLGVAGILQTIPSLALLAFMIPIPFLGLGARSAVAALFLYALLPILRNTYTGIREVDPGIVEAAVGMGLTDGQVLRRVELPIASRTILAGIRTSAVISIGVATLAAFIGAGGLGDPIVTGLQLNDTRLILSGAIPAALLAIVVDWILGRVESTLATT